jgi:hypothetical protein
LRCGEMIALRSGHRLAMPINTSARLTEFKAYPHNIPDHLDARPCDGIDRLIAKVRLEGRAH